MTLSPDQQFWWNWCVGLGGAVGTIGAVLVALYVALHRPKPKLRLTLLRSEGEKTRLNSGEAVRYYHLHVWNERRSSPAKNVQVYLSRLESLDPNNPEVWRGDVPLRWRDQEFVPRFLTLGTARDCDLCRVGAASGLSLMPLFEPNSLVVHHMSACRLLLSVQARANQADSDIVRVEISWNGVWDDDDKEMRRNLAVSCTPIHRPPAPAD